MIRWTVRIGALAVLLLAIYGGYALVGGTIGSAPESLDVMVERELTRRAGEKIADSVTFDPRLASLHVVPIRGDARGWLREEIEERLADKGFIGIEEDASALARQLGRIAGTGRDDDDGLIGRLRAFLNEAAGEEFTEEEALAFGRSAGVSSLLLGRVTENDTVSGERRYTVVTRVLDVASGEEMVPAGEVAARVPLRVTSPDYLALAVRASSPWLRLLVWLGVVLALPFVLLPLVLRVLDRESNGANLLLLLGFSSVGLLLAWFLLGLRLGGPVGFGVLTGGAVLALAYNFVVCTAFENLVRR